MLTDGGDAVVQMWHEGIGQVGTCTVAGFNAVWRHKGWVLVSASAALAADTLGRDVPDIDKLTADDLRTVLDMRGAKSTGTKADMIATLDRLSGGGQFSVVSAPDDGTAPYDPADGTVAGVLAHLDGADPLEADRVLAAERAGKNRAGITERGSS